LGACQSDHRPTTLRSRFRSVRQVLREYLGDIKITEAALNLGVNRVTLPRVVSGSSGISAGMACRLAQAFGTSAEMWAGMQMQNELHQASKIKRPKIDRLAASAEKQESSVL